MKSLLQRAAEITGPDIRHGERDSRNTVVDWATTLIKDSLPLIFIIAESNRPSLFKQMHERRDLFFFFFKLFIYYQSSRVSPYYFNIFLYRLMVNYVLQDCGIFFYFCINLSRVVDDYQK